MISVASVGLGVIRIGFTFCVCSYLEDQFPHVVLATPGMPPRSQVSGGVTTGARV